MLSRSQSAWNPSLMEVVKQPSVNPRPIVNRHCDVSRTAPGYNRDSTRSSYRWDGALIWKRSEFAALPNRSESPRHFRTAIPIPHRWPKTARQPSRGRIHFPHVNRSFVAIGPPSDSRHANRRRDLFPGDGGARRPVRRPVLRGHHDDADLLPADLHGAHRGPRSMPVLFQRRPGGARRVPPLPALPARAGSRPCAGGLGAAHGAGRRRPHRGRRIERRREPGETRPGPGPQLAAAPPRGPAGVRRLADRAGPDPPPAPGQATDHRVGSADRPGGVRQRVRECPSIQRRVPIALPPHPDDHAAVAAPRPQVRDALRLTLAYRPPMAWESLLRFLSGRSTAGVERVEGSSYLRTAAVGKHRGWWKVEPIAGRNALAVELSTSLTPALPEVLARIKDVFDLSARPDVIASHLQSDARIAGLVGRCPGLRVPGAFDGFELAVRAILGQRVSVRAATTLAGRLATRFGEPVEVPFPGLDRLSPAARVSRRRQRFGPDRPGHRRRAPTAIRTIARAVVRRELDLQPGPNPEAVADALQQFPGLGDWTAQYIAMRALRWPDALPAADLGLLEAVALPSAARFREVADAWRPGAPTRPCTSGKACIPIRLVRAQRSFLER